MLRPRSLRAVCLALAVGIGVGLGVVGEARAAPAGEDEDEGSEAAWVDHTVVPKETYDTISARYGVSEAEIKRWNKKRLGKKQWLYAGRTLRIKARIPAPPREKITYTIQKRDTWGKIAGKFGVPVDHVKAWNQETRKRGLIAGKSIKIYTDPKAPPPSAATAAGEAGGAAIAALPTFEVRAGGIGVGSPNRGHLVNAVRLPDTEMVKILDEDKVWGTSHTISLLQRAIAAFRRDSGYDQPLTVSSISLRQGGRFRPHSSHRTGRDVDIRLPRKPGASKGEAPSSIDWTLTWRLIDALVDTGEVEYIFVSWSRQKYLYRAARSAGATKAQLEKIVQYPRKPKERTRAIVRHASGHTVHLHVRFTCTPGNSRCKSY